MASSSTKSLKSAWTKLPKSFYDRHTLEVATDLLGKVLCVKNSRTTLKGLIVETEAYFGRDPASHASTGRLTKSGQDKKCAQMFRDTGTSYVYAAHQGRAMINVVARSKTVEAGAILIRAIEPLMGQKEMIKNRPSARGSMISNGPAKLCQAMGITLKDNGLDLTKTDRVWIEELPVTHARAKEKPIIYSSPRIGINQAVELHWRFFVDDSEYVSPHLKANQSARLWKKHSSYRDLPSVKKTAEKKASTKKGTVVER